jgi:hypothetical protein
MAGLALLGAAAQAPDNEDAGAVVLGVLASGGFGAAIGVGVDAMIRSNEVVFSRPAGVSTRLTVSPLFAASRKSLLLSVGF